MQLAGQGKEKKEECKEKEMVKARMGKIKKKN